MKRGVFAVICAVFAVIAGNSALAAEQSWKMTMTTSYTSKHPASINVWKPWVEAINKETNGRVVIQIFNPNIICPEGEILQAVESGAATIGGAGQNLTPGKFPYAEVINLPLLTSNAEAGSLLSQAGYEHFAALREEEKKMKVLWQWASAPFMLHTVKKPVQALDDLKGMRIIGWYPSIMEVIRALGASPVAASPTDTYMALQRGMADGVLCPLAPVRSFQINEATKYTTDCNIMISNFVMGMNWNVWNSLPDDIKAVFNEYSGEKMARWAGQTLDKGTAADRLVLARQGHVFINLNDEELGRWRTAVAPVHDNWVTKMEAKGLVEAKTILEWHQEMGKTYADMVLERGD